MEATERYGIHSPEARLAWEVVEEFDASTNDSAAYEARDGGLSEDELIAAYNEVGKSMELMRDKRRRASASFKDNQELMRDVASELRAIKLSPPSKQPAPTIPGLWDSKLKARAFTQQFGATSPEARLAWEEVEEIAASGLENALQEHNDNNNLVQAAEACMALEELDRFLYYENYPSGDNLDLDNNNNNNSYDVVDNSMSAYDQAYNQNQNNYDPYQNEDYTGNGGGGTYH